MAKDVAKPRSIKVTNAMWTDWQVRAGNEGVSVAALIIDRMAAPKPARGPKQADLDAALAEVANLKRELAKRPIAEAVSTKMAPVREAYSTDVSSQVANNVSMPIDPTVHHPSGPVLADAVPRHVSGEAKPFFKAGQRVAHEVLGQAPGKGKRS